MTNDEIRATTSASLRRWRANIPSRHSAVVTTILLQVLAAGLHNGDDVATGEFVGAINQRLLEIAEHYGSPPRVWRLVAAVDPPTVE